MLVPAASLAGGRPAACFLPLVASTRVPRVQREPGSGQLGASSQAGEAGRQPQLLTFVPLGVQVLPRVAALPAEGQAFHSRRASLGVSVPQSMDGPQSSGLFPTPASQRVRGHLSCDRGCGRWWPRLQLPLLVSGFGGTFLYSNPKGSIPVPTREEARRGQGLHPMAGCSRSNRMVLTMVSGYRDASVRLLGDRKCVKASRPPP